MLHSLSDQTMASFPLRCTVCPKDPKFSDVSHLLTHIASKGHLSHYFKVQVRSRSDPAAEQTLRTYDKWYAQHDIERLLSQRMMQKESRRGSRSSVPDDPVPQGRSRGKRPRDGPRRAASPSEESLIIDPKLARPVHLPPALQTLPTTPNPKRRPPARRANMAHTLDWQRNEQDAKSTIMTRSRALGRSPLSPPRDRRSLQPDHKRSDVLGFRASHAHGAHLEASKPTSSDAPSLQSNSTPLSDSVGDTESLGDSSKLKGIIWPGMDLFDSASMDARRKRNQKKESTVLKSMQAQSERVEPNEVIYFPTWDIKKSRYISGEVESSPPSSVSPKKRPRPKAGRRPLAELDANQPTISRPRFPKSPTALRHASHAEGTEGHHSSLLQSSFRSLLPSKDTHLERRFEDPARHLDRKMEVFEGRRTGGGSPGSMGTATGSFISRNPLLGFHFLNSGALADQLTEAQNEDYLIDPHGLWAPDESDRNPFYLAPPKVSHPPPFTTERSEPKAATADNSRLFQHSHLSTHRSLAHPLSTISGRSSSGSAALERSRHRPSPMAEHALPRPPLTFFARGSPHWDHQSGVLSGLGGSLGQQSAYSSVRHGESSGDETIDQGIDDCLDLFES